MEIKYHKTKEWVQLEVTDNVALGCYVRIKDAVREVINYNTNLSLKQKHKTIQFKTNGLVGTLALNCIHFIKSCAEDSTLTVLAINRYAHAYVKLRHADGDFSIPLQFVELKYKNEVTEIKTVNNTIKDVFRGHTIDVPTAEKPNIGDIVFFKKELEYQFDRLEHGKTYALRCYTPSKNFEYIIPEVLSRIGGLHFKVVDIMKFDSVYGECACIKLKNEFETVDFLVVPLWFLQISALNQKQDETVVEPLEHQNTYIFLKGLKYPISMVEKLSDTQLQHFVHCSEFDMLCKQNLIVNKDLVDSGILNRQPKMQETADAYNKTNILIEDVEATFTECLATMKKKNNDYAGENPTDVYKNLRACTQFGVPTKMGVVVRLSDKFARIGNLMSQEAAVKDEAIEDTINDAINYLAILKSVLKNKIE